MNNAKPAVLFDLDGTLIDSAADFVAVINLICQRHGVTPPSSDVIRNTVSDGARALIELCFNLKEGDAGFETLKEELLDLYEQELGNAAHLFEGFEALLKQYHKNNQAWGIVTNKPWRFAQPLLQRVFAKIPELYPASVICPDHVSIAKPDPEGLLLACKELNVDPANTWYVGDHIRDIEAGNNANMTTIACQYGYIKNQDEIQTWQANHIAMTVNDIARLTS